MSFKSEQQMYLIIADHFHRLGYDTRIDSPQQNGIKFDLLKGWTIDVAGMRKRGGTPEVIAVEAKNDLGAQSVTQAISQAEMYKNVCTKVYVAFPGKHLGLKENKEVTTEIQELCETKGIGLLSVRRECKEIVKATSLPLRIHMYNDIVNQFKGTARHFEGFDVEDFARAYVDGDSEYVRHKFGLLAEELNDKLAPRELYLSHSVRGTNWWYSYSRKLRVGERYYNIPHFTLSLRDDGVVMELITRDKAHLSRFKKNIKKKWKRFISVMMSLKTSRFRYDISVLENVHVKGYVTNTASSYEVNSKYLNRERVSRLVESLTEVAGNAWLMIECPFHMANDEVKSRELVDSLGKIVDELRPIYEFIIQQ